MDLIQAYVKLIYFNPNKQDSLSKIKDKFSLTPLQKNTSSGNLQCKIPLHENFAKEEKMPILPSAENEILENKSNKVDNSEDRFMADYGFMFNGFDIRYPNLKISHKFLCENKREQIFEHPTEWTSSYGFTYPADYSLQKIEAFIFNSSDNITGNKEGYALPFIKMKGKKTRHGTGNVIFMACRSIVLYWGGLHSLNGCMSRFEVPTTGVQNF